MTNPFTYPILKTSTTTTQGAAIHDIIEAVITLARMMIVLSICAGFINALKDSLSHQ